MLGSAYPLRPPLLAHGRTQTPALQRQASGIVGLLSLIAYLMFALPEYGYVSRLLGWAIFMYAFVSTMQAAARRVVPVLELAFINFTIFYSLPIFHEQEFLAYNAIATPEDGAVSLVLGLTLVAMLSLRFGTRFMEWLARRPSFPRIELRYDPDKLFRLAVVILSINIVLSFNQAFIPPVARFLVQVVLSVSMGLGIMALLYYRQQLSPNQRKVAAGFLITFIALGFSTGSSEAFLLPVFVWSLCRWIVERRYSRALLITGAVLFVVFQPVKLAYREDVFRNGESANAIEAGTRLMEVAYNYWISGTSRTETAAQDATEGALDRVSALLLTTVYVSKTPSEVPYKNGTTIWYVFYGWVPRFIWSNKPRADLANYIMPVEYGLQSIESIDRTRFAVGMIADAYVNFGYAGFPVLFFVLGMIYALPGSLLGHNSRNVATTAILVSFAVFVMYVSNAISYQLGGVWQQVLMPVLIITLFCPPRVLRARGLARG